jgi:hypothetical protein
MVIARVMAALTILLMSATAALATPTQITVCVKAKDAKFIGTTLGGVLITIKNADTGELLAKGVTAGTTGNTETMMKKPHQRGVSLSGEKTAKFTATIDIDQPTLVKIGAYGPLAQRQSAGKVSVTQWIVPGKNITKGDGVLLEIPGFVVDVLAPPAHMKLSKENVPKKLELRANVTMMCGCPIEPGGVWDANKFEVRALVKKNGKPVGEIPLTYTGETSQFGSSLDVQGEGVYQVTVYAFDPSNGNTGVDTTTVIVQ